LIAEFQTFILGAGPDFASGTPASGGLPFAPRTLQLLGRDFLAGFLRVFPGKLRERFFIAGGIGDIEIAIPAKTTATSL
jgi:hypothetical protein